MKFGPVAVTEAEGCLLAQAGRIAKGTVLTAEDVERLRTAGVETVIVARLEPGDMQEDAAAARLSSAITGDHLRFTPATTGRVNIHATSNGLFVADKARVDRLNRVDPAITLACLADHVSVAAGDMVATLKIIPLAMAEAKVEEARQVLLEAPPFEVKPFSPRDVTLIATTLPSLKPSVMDKTARLLEQRLIPSGSTLKQERRVAHRDDAVADALKAVMREPSACDRMIIVFGASAVCDPADVIPQAIRLAGGDVIQVGLPVDPGNLLVLGRVGEVPVIGAPGCARSPKENGFDWVLARILAGETPDTDSLTGLGVGGLLMEIPSRPMPRAKVSGEAPPLHVAAIVLAAGQARRMGEAGPHKLLAEFDGQPLVRRTVERVLSSQARSVTVVLGHRAEEVRGRLDGLDAELVFNPDYGSGMASSLRAGLAAVSGGNADGVLVALADMPAVRTEDLDVLIDRFRQEDGRAIIRAVSAGKRGNPVILPRNTFAAFMKLEGDIGARAIIETSGLEVVDVEIGAAAHLDVDTPEAVLGAGGVLKD